MPVEVKQQPDGRLTVVIKQADGKVEEIADNDQVLMATGEELCRKRLHWLGGRVGADLVVSRSWAVSRGTRPLTLWARPALTPQAVPLQFRSRVLESGLPSIPSNTVLFVGRHLSLPPTTPCCLFPECLLRLLLPAP